MPKTDKKTAFSLQGFDAASYKQTEAYTRAIDLLYNNAVNEYAALAGKVKLNPNRVFSFDDYPQTKAKAQQIAVKLSSGIKAVIKEGSRKQWLYACKKNDEFLAHILDTSKVAKKTLEKYQDKNLDALSAFQVRKVNGLDLSGRIWNYTGQLKTQMELGIDIGLGDGKSAQELSRDLRQYLVDPDKLFRRVRDKHGNLVLSKNAKAFNPGQGKYRSSYKNAMRLTRSEINMAYRESDQIRWRTLDFVVGFEVKTSNNHPIVDICDSLKGKYPKTFKFVGWHPQCRCHAVPILMDRADFNTDELNELKAAINGTEYRAFEASNKVYDLPEGFKTWASDNLERSKGWKSQPYFIRDNFEGGTLAGAFKASGKSIGKVSKPIEDIGLSKIEYTEKQIENAKKAYNAMLHYRTVESYEPQYIGRAAAEQRAEFHNNKVREILNGNKALEREWKLFFLKEEVMADKKASDIKLKLAANKSATQSVLDFVKSNGFKLGDYYEFIKKNKKYAKEFFSKKFTIESAKDFMNM